MAAVKPHNFTASGYHNHTPGLEDILAVALEYGTPRLFVQSLHLSRHALYVIAGHQTAFQQVKPFGFRRRACGGEHPPTCLDNR